ncbi:hypothetical protein GHK52_10555 [Lactococcus garvieae]|nr:hypothetical protein [Lactococcus garvieae]
MQLEEIPVVNLTELTKDGKVYVMPEYETVARTAEMPEHTVFSAAGDGEKNFHIVCFGKVPKKEELRKAVLGGLVEIEVEGHEPTLIDFNYAENGVTKNQMALRLNEVKIKGGK